MQQVGIVSGNLGSVARFSLHLWDPLPQPWFPSAQMDAHTTPPTALCLSPPKCQKGGRTERGCSCPSVPVPHQPARSGHARVTHQQVPVTAPCPWYLIWSSHDWNTMAWAWYEQTIKTVTGEWLWPVTRGNFCSWASLGLEGEGWDHGRLARASRCGTYSESEVSACPVPTWRVMAMPLSWSRDCSLRTFFTVTPESEGERSPSFVPREAVLDGIVLWL